MLPEIPKNDSLEPFLRWAGGKRWLIKKEKNLAPDKFKTYIEPFLGSASVFFSMPKTPFIISDVNSDLINCYLELRKNHEEIEKLLKIHQQNHSKDYYYKIRAEEPISQADNAARFLYLNRTCFNGIYRVNKLGKFNVPIGTKYHDFLENVNFADIAKRLNEGNILNQDFEKTMSLAGDGDFIFIDPPYTVNHNLNGFIEYNEKIFSWEDQIRLKKSVISALERGAMITMSNADHESMHDLYSGICEIQRIERNSVIAGKSTDRKVTSEIIMRFGWND